MKRSSGSRKTAKFSPTINRHLNMYALVASTAGVGVLALTQSAEAKIVYSAAHIPIVVNGPVALLDLNNDGVIDFTFRNTFLPTNCLSRHSCTESIRATLSVTPQQQTNGVWYVRSYAHLCAAALKKGRRVGPFSPFTPEEGLWLAFISQSSGTNFNYCPWLNVKSAYLGLKFVITGKTHFGWVRITMAGLGADETITDYAYETINGKSIIVGKKADEDDAEQVNPESLFSPPFAPATLGELAMGAPGLSIWRRKASEGGNFYEQQ
jgi:hypothetical protein